MAESEPTQPEDRRRGRMLAAAVGCVLVGACLAAGVQVKADRAEAAAARALLASGRAPPKAPPPQRPGGLDGRPMDEEQRDIEDRLRDAPPPPADAQPRRRREASPREKAP